MPRAKVWGYLAVLVSLFIYSVIFYSIFISNNETAGNMNLNKLSSLTYYSIAAPITAVALFVIGTGFWIGYTILSIKVVPPMPEITEKKDNSKIKAFLLCLATFSAGLFLLYGFYIRSYWSLAIPAAVISLVILGAVFWVGIAIITTRSTLKNRD